MEQADREEADWRHELAEPTRHDTIHHDAANGNVATRAHANSARRTLPVHVFKIVPTDIFIRIVSLIFVKIGETRIWFLS